jgi:hypothetical protein
MKFFKQINSLTDTVLEPIPVEIENSPITKLFIQKHKDSLREKYE